MIEKYVEKNSDGTYSIDSGLPEFGYELISTIPYAYHLYKKNKLKKTTSGIDTTCLYFFSKEHHEVSEKRSWDNVKNLTKANFPNIEIHRNQLDWDFFDPPPYKEYFKSGAIKFQKPTVVICNRINKEWQGDPVNFIDRETLEKLFENLYRLYEIIYIDPSMFGSDYEDHASFIKNDIDSLLYKYSIRTFLSLRDEYPNISVNELQCRIYAGCERFISSNGGLGIFCSYFGGENIIYSRMCRESDKHINSFYAWYPRLSKSIIKVAENENDLINIVIEKWVKNNPLFNIIIRTSGRPNYFHDCIKSIKNQSYSNYNIVVGFDDPESMQYIQGHPCTAIAVKKNTEPEGKKPESEDYGIWFPFNSYFNQLLPYAAQGYVIYLDDDDCLDSNDALSNLSSVIKSEKADVIFWRVKFPKRIVPSDENWEKKVPVCRDMSTIGYCHSSRIKPVWEPWKRGDYRVAKYIYENAEKIAWHDRILTGLQRVKQDGYGLRDDKAIIDISVPPPLAVLITAFKATAHLERCIDSVINQNLKNSPLKIFVGIDGCTETFKEAKKLTRKYKEAVKFFYSKENCGTYKVKNALLRKIIDRDSLVFFLDSDDIIPGGFLDHYIAKHSELNADVLQILGVDISEERIAASLKKSQLKKNAIIRDLLDKINKNTTNLALEDALNLVVNYGTIENCGLYLSLLRKHTLLERINATHTEFKPVSRHPHGSFFARYTALETLNYFNEFRVAQDSDLLNRAKKTGLKTFRANRKNTFSFLVRSVRKSSLTQGAELGINSDARNKIVKINEERIRDGNLAGSGEMATLSIIL